MQFLFLRQQTPPSRVQSVMISLIWGNAFENVRLDRFDVNLNWKVNTRQGMEIAAAQPAAIYNSRHKLLLWNSWLDNNFWYYTDKPNYNKQAVELSYSNL